MEFVTIRSLKFMTINRLQLMLLTTSTSFDEPNISHSPLASLFSFKSRSAPCADNGVSPGSAAHSSTAAANCASHSTLINAGISKSPSRSTRGCLKDRVRHMISDFMCLCGLRTSDSQLSTDVSRQAWGQVTKHNFSLLLHKSDHNYQVSFRFSFLSNFKNQTLKP